MWPVKIVPEMTNYVSGETLNPNHLNVPRVSFVSRKVGNKERARV